MIQTQQIGKYEIIEKIGAGGFGEVFKARDTLLNKVRALKVPFSKIADIEKALAEARHQAEISHRAVVQVHAVEEIEDKWIISMDYAGGGNLRSRLEKHGPISVDRAVGYTIELAGALSESHSKGLLHYDIKPENILFDDDQIKLTDFGVARKMEKTGKKMSRIIGTVEYMGPEQLNGYEDKRSEIWSLGTVFYEMLTGRVCFEGRVETDLILSINQGEYTPARRLKPGVPKAVERIINKMLRRDPERRYQSMDDVIKDLTSLGATCAPEKPKSIVPSIMIFAIVTLCSFGGGVLYANKAGILDITFLQQFRQVKLEPLPEDILRLGPESLFGRGLTEVENGDYQLAYQIFNRIEKSAGAPELREKAAFYKASIALHYLKDDDLALAGFNNYLKSYSDSQNPFVGNAHYFIGQIYFEKKNDFYRAIKHLTAVIEKFPENYNVGAARILMEKAAIQLVKSDDTLELTVKSAMSGFKPNNILSLLISLLGLISAVAMPLAWIMSQYHQPQISDIPSVRSGFRQMLKHKAIKKLIFIVIISQILSFALTHYQSHLEYKESTSAIRKVGIHVNER